MSDVQIGDRIRITGIMPDDPDPMPIGSTGTVDYIGCGQLWVVWDPGVDRHLMVLPTDPFEVIGS